VRTKIVKTLLDQARPVGRYVGIDVSPMIIDWLEANAHDHRFEFHHFDATTISTTRRGSRSRSSTSCLQGPTRST
jgi:hypothetical protein